MRNGPAVERPVIAGARLARLVAASGVQLAFLLWVAGTATHQALHCEVCDTTYYFTVATEFTRSGLLFTNPYDGYRSYFVPMFMSTILRLTSGFDAGVAERYTYGVAMLFWLLSLGQMAWLARRATAGTFWATSAATLLNPFLVVYVPFALQEGVLLACCLPLLFLWVGARDWSPARRAALVMMMALLAYAIRASLVWWLLPAALYAGWLLCARIGQWRRRVAPIVALAVCAGVLIGPQIYISHHRFGSFNPYPSTGVLSQQVAWGIVMHKLATVEDEGHWRGLVYWSPFAAEPDEDKTVRFYLARPERAAFLTLSHAYVGFHYDQLEPYWRLDQARPLTVWLVLSSAVVFLGIVRMSADLVGGKVDADGAFVIATFALCALSLLLLAAESRFGIIGFAMLSIRVSQWLASRPSRAELSVLAPALVLYVAVSFLYNAMLLQSADIGL